MLYRVLLEASSQTLKQRTKRIQIGADCGLLIYIHWQSINRRRIKMLLDVRTYTCKPGTLKKHLELYAKMGAEPQSRNLGKPLLYMTTETGNPNQYIHIWALSLIHI